MRQASRARPSLRPSACRPALYDGCKALSRFEARTPLLILPSHNWAIPDPGTGLLGCDSERREHERVLAAAAAVQQGGQRLGGALLLSIAGSSHNTFAGKPATLCSTGAR